MRINDLQNEYELVTDSQDVKNLADSLGFDLQDCDSLLYCLDNEGDYISEVWGFSGVIPYLIKQVTKLL